jgi:branched-subunit amino acid aminotransferase/4-amino-4-deoxychorismate lyase
LPGITRAAVLSLCRDEGVPLVESPFGVEEILSSDEAFLTSSIRGILPVTRCNAQPIGDGKPGPLTRRLMARYDERHLSTRR